MLDLFFLIGYKTVCETDGSLAQLEEHLVYTERVGSSNLSTPTNQKAAEKVAFFVAKIICGEGRRKGGFFVVLICRSGDCKKMLQFCTKSVIFRQNITYDVNY